MDKKIEKMRDRTREFAVRIVRLYQSLPATSETKTIGGQLLHCAPMMGAKFWSSCHSFSRIQYAKRIGLVAELADECVYWLELLADPKLASTDRIDPLLEEARKLAAIFAATRQKAKQRR